ncbi:MAG: OmpA family protein [Rhodospirillaceae bacterium]|nr:OmpA family protein [Rhodospirillaceae bacterium]
MAKQRCTTQIATSVSSKILAILVAPTLFVAAATKSSDSFGQSTDDVSVNLDVLDDLDPIKTLPRLLMPSSRPHSGRIVLTPPAGVNAITPQRARVVLRPPPGAPPRIASAPKISVPPRAPAALAPPISVTAPSSPAPSETVIPPAPATPAPVAQSLEPEETATAGPMMPSQAIPTPLEQTSEYTQSKQVAALPESEPGLVSITFGREETELPSSAAAALTAISEKMISNRELRVQLLAYASSADGSPSSVRRKSLSRALSVREFLIDQGIQSTRIEVRALGNQNEGGVADRVDALVERR